MKTVNVLHNTPVRDADVFALKVGMLVLDKATGVSGVVSDIRETGTDWVEAFVRLDGSDKEIKASALPECVLINPSIGDV
jgi:hypothetical protein